MIDKDRIRASIREQWRQRLLEEAQKYTDDPIELGMRVAKALDEYADEIEQDIAEEISAAESRGGS